MFDKTGTENREISETHGNASYEKVQRSYQIKNNGQILKLKKELVHRILHVLNSAWIFDGKASFHWHFFNVYKISPNRSITSLIFSITIGIRSVTFL